MQELKFKLEVYEGPLDLMLSLIAKHKLNIYDIEISLLLEQFMLYLDRMKQADIEIAGEFLEKAYLHKVSRTSAKARSGRNEERASGRTDRIRYVQADSIAATAKLGRR